MAAHAHAQAGLPELTEYYRMVMGAQAQATAARAQARARLEQHLVRQRLAAAADPHAAALASAMGLSGHPPMSGGMHLDLRGMAGAGHLGALNHQGIAGGSHLGALDTEKAHQRAREAARGSPFSRVAPEGA